MTCTFKPKAHWFKIYGLHTSDAADNEAAHLIAVHGEWGFKSTLPRNGTMVLFI